MMSAWFRKGSGMTPAMPPHRWLVMLAAATALSACQRDLRPDAAAAASTSRQADSTPAAQAVAAEPRGEQGSGGGEGEESSVRLRLSDRYDKVRRGVRLVLAYDSLRNAFVGTVENTTGLVLARVRVEVHLSNGEELGPTPAGHLAPGERRAVSLSATGRDFDGWTAHAETGEGENADRSRERPDTGGP